MPPKEGGKKKSKNKKKAILLVQKYIRGWLCRCYYKKLKVEAHLNRRKIEQERECYEKHLLAIMVRHKEEDMPITFELSEIFDYLVKKRKYEQGFKLFAGERDTIPYDDIKPYFKSLNLNATSNEIGLAAELLIQESGTETGCIYKEVDFTQLDTFDIAMHIYVPKGTKLGSKRVSTWMNPIVGGDDVLKLLHTSTPKDAKELKSAKLGKCVKITSKAMKNKDTPVKILTRSEELLEKLKSGNSRETTPDSSGSSSTPKKKSKR